MQEIYLDNAATSHPKPQTVYDAVLSGLTTDNANPGRSGHSRAIRAAERVFKCRENVARILNAPDAMDIAFTFNCTDALNLAIKGILRMGDHVVCSVLEHNSVLRILGEMEARGAITVTYVSPTPAGYIDPVSYARAIRKNTHLFILTHASNVTGAVQPVREVGMIARLHGIEYLIDGAQAAGERSFSVPDLLCDMYAFPGHKALLGPQGTGGLFIKNGLRLKPFREGGTGSASTSVLQPFEMPDRYESGTMNLPGLCGLSEGAKYVFEHLKEIESSIQLLSQALYEGLSKIPGITLYSPCTGKYRTGVISFNICDLSSGEAADLLSEMGFCIRGGLHCAPLAHRFLGTEKRGAVRCGIGYANTLLDVESFLNAVTTISKNQGPA